MESNHEFWDKLAIKAYKSLLKKNPECAMIHNNLGIVYLRTEKINKAINCFKRCIKFDKNYVDAYYHLGKAYLKIGENQKSILYLTKYTKIQEKSKIYNSVVAEVLSDISN